MDCHVSKIPVLLPTDDNAVYVITGANRGIGLEHARQFLEKTKAAVVCTVRKSSTVKHLQAFKEQGHGHRLLLIELDTTDESSIQIWHAVQHVAKCCLNARYIYTVADSGSCRASGKGLPSGC